MTARWQDQQERGSAVAVGFMRWAARRLGRWPVRVLLYPITLYFLLTSAQGRRASRDYLRRVGQPTGWSSLFRHFHTFAAVILDRVYFFLGDVERFNIEVHGYEQVASAVEARGALLLGSHLGSFDAVRAMAVKGYGVRLKVMMQHEQNPIMTRTLESINPQMAAAVIPLGGADSLLKAKEWLDAGGSVGLLGDRLASLRRACRCRFLGGEANFPSGPWWMAVRLRVPVVLFFGIYRGGNRYAIYLEEMEWPQGVEGDHALVCALAQRYAEKMESYVRDAPYNWFNFYPFWLAQADSAPPADGAASARLDRGGGERQR